MVYAFGLLIITCELGQRVCNAFDECNDILNQFHWYLFAPNIQRMLPTIINFTQRPVVFCCFGSTAAIRETFKYVRIDNAQFFPTKISSWINYIELPMLSDKQYSILVFYYTPSFFKMMYSSCEVDTPVVYILLLFHHVTVKSIFFQMEIFNRRNYTLIFSGKMEKCSSNCRK